MLKSLARRIAHRWSRIEVTIVRLNTAKPLSRRLSRSRDEQLDRALSAAGLERGALFTAYKGNARHRKRMAAMMARFRIDTDRACAAFWPELKEADDLCADCPHAHRCMRLLEWGVRDETVRRICPNARLFDRIALDQRLGRALDSARQQ